jgi:chemotaxis receptor (MCP) glutamine deamidase CheD
LPIEIGKKNIGAVKHALIEIGLTIRKADLRENARRMLTAEVKTGSVEVPH